MNQESSFKKNKKNLYSLQLNSDAFTLAEIIVVMAIVAIVGTILVTIFTNTLRGSNKAQVLAVIKQNGQAVLENMDKTIRGADDVICPIPNATSNTLVVVKNGTYTRYKIEWSTNATNGYIAQDSPVKQDVTGSSPLRKETDTEFMSRICGFNDTMDASTGLKMLTDNNNQTGVSVKTGSFKNNSSSGFKEQITIQFNLMPGTGVTQTISSQIDPVVFQTTIGLR